MYIRALNITFSGASAEMKFLIIQLLRRYRPHQVIEVPVKVLAKSLGVSDHVVTAGCAYLEAQGFLVRERAKKGGQAGYRMWLTEKMYSHVERHGPLAYVEHAPIIERVLSLGSEDQPSLSSTKLLSAVLLINADLFGVVKGIGRSRLSELTGMKRGRLSSQLAELQRQGYISLNVVGVNGLRLFGKRPGVYFLNAIKLYPLERVSLINTVSMAKLIFEVAAWIDNAVGRKECGSIINKYIELQAFRLALNSDFVFIYHFFCGSDKGVQEYFQMKLDEYASQLMSRHSLAELEGPCFYNQDILENIYLEFYSSIYFVRCDDLNITAKARYELLVNFVYESSWMMAKTILVNMMIFEEKHKNTTPHGFDRSLKTVRILPFYYAPEAERYVIFK